MNDPTEFARRWKKAPDALVETYSCGCCMWLALALHDRYGWTIRAQIAYLPASQGGNYIAHAYNVLPDGREVDIMGLQDSVDIFSQDETREFQPAELLKYLAVDASSGEVRLWMKEAHAVVDEYFPMPEVPTIPTRQRRLL